MTMTPSYEEIATGAHEGAAPAQGEQATNGPGKVFVLRALGLSTVGAALFFIFNNYLNFWQDWPGIPQLFAHHELLGLGPLRTPLEVGDVTKGWIQFLLYFVVIGLSVLLVQRSPDRGLREDAERLTAFSAYIARGAFWSVLFIGLADMAISFLRVEELLAGIVGEDLAQDLGRSTFRGTYVHYPLILVSFIVAAFTRTLGFVWLAFFIVIAELQIVIARFVFSYEQAFMADLVRFWYGALFLFASAYTLITEGHVRVDILYTSFTRRGKALTNFFGSLILGIPLCWIILTRGMWGKTNVINGPLLNFEVTQSGFGLFVKYFMAGFLVIYALTMLIQFVSYCLSSAADLLGEPDLDEGSGDEASTAPETAEV